MYPDPITPRAHPDLLARVDYDPFGVMPGAAPEDGRVFASNDMLLAARQRIERCPVDRECFGRLIAACKLDEELPQLVDSVEHPDWGGPLTPWLNLAFRNALAYRLTDQQDHRDRALDILRRSANAVARTSRWTGHENNEARSLARAYDLLRSDPAMPLGEADHASFQEMLRTLIGALDQASHHGCNNHNSMQMSGRLSLAAALGDRQAIHDTLYGYQRNGRWRYGLIHLMRHDFLADGLQWEGSPSYHMLVVANVAECFTIMERLGVDLWHRRWPSLNQDDGHDEHRGWGPRGDRPFEAALDAMLYQPFGNGDFSLLHDSGLGNLAGTPVWWPIYAKAWEVYGHSRYAWALQHTNGGQPVTADGPTPPWLQGNNGDVEFVRIETRAFPADQAHPLQRDHQFALTGRHTSHCTLFESDGVGVLRVDPTDPHAPGAYLYWGPHWAGHRSPAALHMELHHQGQRITTAPHLYRDGYGEPLHGTWFRSTVAHNTIALDGQSMFPYDFPTDSLWECDHWRDTISDGKLEGFQPHGLFKAIRASNDNVYPGVRLDRTIALTADYLLDVYRVTADRERMIDLATHINGSCASPPHAEPVDLGDTLGYRHLRKARKWGRQGDWQSVHYTCGSAEGKAMFWLGGAANAQLITALDPEVDDRLTFGDPEPARDRTSVLLRAIGASAVFVTLWPLTTVAMKPIGVEGDAGSDVKLTVSHAERMVTWRFPTGAGVICEHA